MCSIAIALLPAIDYSVPAKGAGKRGDLALAVAKIASSAIRRSARLSILFSHIAGLAVFANSAISAIAILSAGAPRALRVKRLASGKANPILIYSIAAARQPAVISTTIFIRAIPIIAQLRAFAHAVAALALSAPAPAINISHLWPPASVRTRSCPIKLVSRAILHCALRSTTHRSWESASF